MDDSIKNDKARKRRGAPGAPTKPLEIGNTTATVAGGHDSDAVEVAANQSHHEPAPPEPAPPTTAPSEPSGTAPARKRRLVRASFALPRQDHELLAELKQACRQDGIAVKKSQLLRVALGLLRQTDRAEVKQMLAQLPATKPARRGKGK
jgi:flagellar basal body-associated protein FliL